MASVQVSCSFDTVPLFKSAYWTRLRQTTVISAALHRLLNTFLFTSQLALLISPTSTVVVAHFCLNLFGYFLIPV